MKWVDWLVDDYLTSEDHHRILLSYTSSCLLKDKIYIELLCAASRGDHSSHAFVLRRVARDLPAYYYH